MMAPGHLIGSVARRVASARTMERIVEPAIADLQHERDAALAAGRPWRARWAVVAGHVGLCKALAMCAAAALMRGFRGSDSPDSLPIGRSLGMATLAFFIVTALLVLPPLLSVPPRIRSNPMLLIVTLVPQAIPISIAFGLAIGIAAALCRTAVTRRTLLFVLVFGVAASAASLATREWMIPESNQMFREIVARERGITIAPTRGLIETPLSDLLRRGDAQSAEHLKMMAAVCLAPVVLAVFSFAMSTLTRRRLAAALLSVAGPLIYYEFLWNLAARSTDLPATATWVGTAALWLPIAFLAFASILLLTSAGRRRA